jgi:glutamate dehydrogenase
MMDLLVPNDQIVDHYGKPEFIFCGPDEGTAGELREFSFLLY